ncbi:hypothetical protein ASwh1_316 [Aeromonas phage Aswh_1]|nr:hypothetical protein ASwh1_316 [Aeromonas phage Aswh_1]
MIDLMNVDEFFTSEIDKDVKNYKFVNSEKALASIQKFFPNVKKVFVRYCYFQQNSDEETVVSDVGFDLCSTDVYMVLDGGIVMCVGSSEWGWLQQADVSGFVDNKEGE